jgi:hypothetical protein
MQQLIEDSTDAYYHDIKQVAFVSDKKALADTSPLKRTVAYYNHLSVPVTVVGRDGLAFKIPPSTKRHNTFVIRVTYTVDIHSVTIDPNHVYYHHGSDTPEGKALKAALEAIDGKQTFGKPISFSLDYTVSRDDVVSEDGNLYLSDLDIVISVLNNNAPVVHPYSYSLNRFKLMEAETEVNHKNRFGYSIYIVSNHGMVNDKYINIGGTVYRVPAIEDKTLRDGVYLCSDAPVKNKASNPMPQYVEYTFEEAKEKLKLYDSAEEADKLGDQLAEREKEIKELQVKYRELEHDLKIERMEFEREIEEKKREYEKLAMDRQESQARIDYERNIRAMRDKEFYESRSLARKDSSEIVKFVPTIVTGTIALAVLLFKYKQ